VTPFLDLDDFARTCLRLTERGWIIDEAQYHGRFVGAWFISFGPTVEKARHRLVWEPRERWLILEELTGPDRWQNLLVSRQPETALDEALAFIAANVG
jgi:hypothetical protein